MRVDVDAGKCEGHARCWAMLPEVFDTDDHGYAFVVNDGVVPEGKEQDARDAVENCPERAVLVVEPSSSTP